MCCSCSFVDISLLQCLPCPVFSLPATLLMESTHFREEAWQCKPHPCPAAITSALCPQFLDRSVKLRKVTFFCTVQFPHLCNTNIIIIIIKAHLILQISILYKKRWRSSFTRLDPLKARNVFFFFNFTLKQFFWLCQVLVVTCRIFRCSVWAFCCGVWASL